MAYWLLKTEPAEYGYEDLARAGRGVWDGVRHPRALANLRRIAPGDPVFIYHTGKVKAIVGLAEAASPPYPDPKLGEPRYPVVDLVPRGALQRPVTLAELKADPAFAGWELVRLPRLSVMPVPPEHWRRILALAASPPRSGEA